MRKPSFVPKLFSQSVRQVDDAPLMLCETDAPTVKQAVHVQNAITQLLDFGLVLCSGLLDFDLMPRVGLRKAISQIVVCLGKFFHILVKLRNFGLVGSCPLREELFQFTHLGENFAHLEVVGFRLS